MNEKLKALIEKIEKESNFTVKWVHYWHQIGTVDSLIYDTYEDHGLQTSYPYTC